MTFKGKKKWNKSFLVCVCRSLAVLVGVLLPTLLRADTAPSAILNQYSMLRGSWISAVGTAAQNLFGALALIEFSWSAAVLLLEKSDFQSWTAGVVRKLMWIGGFYTLLTFGPVWIPEKWSLHPGCSQNSPARFTRTTTLLSITPLWTKHRTSA